MLGGPRHGPRPLDVDLLLLGDRELDDERLTLPHPELTTRRFVLQPLLELAPGPDASGRDARCPRRWHRWNRASASSRWASLSPSPGDPGP